MSRSPSLLEIPMDIMPSSGKPTAETSIPKSASGISFPAFAPRMSGKIRLPAPKNIPKSMDEIRV